MAPTTGKIGITRRQAWLLAVRPKTLPAAVGPVLVGTGLAIGNGVFKLLPALAALAGALLLQIASNLANDYYDFVRGKELPERKGPTRVALSGLISLGELRLSLGLVLGLTALIGAYLVLIGGWPILAVGVASMIASVAYSAGPYPLAEHGLGDLFVFLFFGLAAVVGTYYVQALSAPPLVWLAAVPPGTLITAILVVNNLRDIDADRRVGKITLAVRLGPAGTRVEYALLLGLTYLVPLLMLLWNAAQGGGRLTSVLLLLPWLSLPRALRLRRTIDGAGDGPTMNRALAGTAQLSLVFSLLFAIGLALWAR